MTLQEFESGLYHQLFDFFYDFGFEMMAGKKQFRRKTDSGFQNVIFSPAEHEGEIWLDVNLGVRHEAIETIAQQFLDTFQDFRDDSNTLVISVAKLTNNKYFRYKVINQEDLELTARQIDQFLRYEGFAFLKQCSGLGPLDNILNVMPGKPCKYLYNQAHRCYKGTIAAHLNCNPKFKDLTSVYLKYLHRAGAKPQIIDSYKKLLQYLEHYHSN